MTASARKKKKVNISNDITVFLRTKGWIWHSEQHLFSTDKEQIRMRKYCGKKVGGDYIILMLKPDDASRRNSARVRMERVQCVSPRLVS